MKKIALVGTTLALAIAAGSTSAASAAPAAGPVAGNFGINVAFAPEVSAIPLDYFVNGKYFISKNMAVLAGVGLQLNDSGAPANSKSTNVGIMGGFRYYLKTDELAPFVGGRLRYASARVGANDVSAFELGVQMGAEYYFSQHFSVEGSFMLGYSSADAKPVGGGTSVKATSFGSSMPTVSANFYF